MARRGSFGRVPRAAPSLTSTIVAIAREMQAQRDKNLMDAWQNGGTFEGQKATDEMVLKHWKGRMDGVDQNDPDYDKYKNAYMQYDYAIHESKMTMLYAQGKLSDRGMANFYLNWAKKVPKDSEFYRSLQRDGAQFLRASAARGRASGKQAKEDSYNKAQFDDHRKNEAGGEFILDTLRALAQRGSADFGVNRLIGAPGSGSDFEDFDAGDPEQMLRLLDLITPRTDLGRVVNNPTVLFHDDMGRAWTGDAIAAQMKKLDPKFNGKLDVAYVKSIIGRQMDGIQKRIDRAEKTGHKSDANALMKQQEYVASLGRRVNAWSVEKTYMNLRQQYQNVINSPTSMPQDVVDAWTKYQGSLEQLAKDPNIATDDNMRAMLMGEARQDEGSQTVAEGFDATASGDRVSGGKDIAMNKRFIESYQAQIDQVATDPNSAWTTGVIDDQGNFQPQAGGPYIGAATIQEIRGVSPVEPKFMFVPGATGRTTPVLVTGVDVMATATDENGENVAMTNKNPVASLYQVNVNGQVTQVYGFKLSDGTTMYSAEPPWNENLVPRIGPGGVTIDVSGLVPPRNADGSYAAATGFEMRGVKPATARTPANPGKLNMDPTAVVLTSDPARNAAGGFDPTTDFFSPTIAALMSTTEGQNTLGKLQKDPAFMTQLDYEARQSAGMSLVNGVWTGGNTDLYGRFKVQENLSMNTNQYPSGLRDFIDQSQALWNRTSTQKTFFGTPDKRQAEGLMSDGSRLPIDQLRGTKFEALAEPFIPGTMLLKPPTDPKTRGNLNIDLVGTLKVPGYSATPPAPNVSPKPAPTPTPIPVPTPAPPPTPQTTYSAPKPGPVAGRNAATYRPPSSGSSPGAAPWQPPSGAR